MELDKGQWTRECLIMLQNTMDPLPFRWQTHDIIFYISVSKPLLKSFCVTRPGFLGAGGLTFSSLYISAVGLRLKRKLHHWLNPQRMGVSHGESFFPRFNMITGSLGACFSFLYSISKFIFISFNSLSNTHSYYY